MLGMSIRCDWVMACQTVLVDRLSGKVSLIHVLENLQVPQFPAEIGPLQVVATWQHTVEMAGDARLRLELQEQGGESSVLAEEQVQFSGRATHRTICVIHALKVQRPGSYRIVARLQGVDGQWLPGNEHAFDVAGSVPARQAEA
jgi:hypothetical protein